MKFSAQQGLLHRALTVMGHALSPRTHLSIENYLLARTEAGRIRLSASQQDMGLHYWFPAEHIEEEGQALLPAHLLADFVRHIPSAPIVVTAPSPTQADACQVCCLRTSAQMKNGSDDPAEFPALPTFAQGGQRLMQLDSELLKQIIRQTAFVATNKAGESDTLTNGLRIEIGAGNALFAGTDSFRLAMWTIPIPDEAIEGAFLVPAKTLEVLAQLLPDEGSVHLLLTPDQKLLLFHLDVADLSLDLCARLLVSETYPNLRRVIPATWTTRAIMNTQEFATTVKLMQPYAQKTGGIQVTLLGEQTPRSSLTEEANTVHLQTVAQDVGTVENVVAAQVEGPDQHMLLNAKYLAEALSVLDTPTVALEVTTNIRPAVLKTVGAGEYVYVLMPMLHQTRASQPADPASSTREESVATH